MPTVCVAVMLSVFNPVSSAAMRSGVPGGGIGDRFMATERTMLLVLPAVSVATTVKLRGLIRPSAVQSAARSS